MEEKGRDFELEKVTDPTNVLLSFLLAVAVVLFIIGCVATFKLNRYESIVVSVSTVFVYAVVVYFLLKPKYVKRKIKERVERVERVTVPAEVPKTFEKSIKEEPIIEPESIKSIKSIEKPKSSKVVKPIIKEVIRTVEKPIIKTITKPVLKTVLVERPKRKLNIPKYKYRGSSATKTYHKVTCRISKSIKNKYKVSNNDPNFFIKRGYKPCQICLGKKKKAKKSVSKKKS